MTKRAAKPSERTASIIKQRIVAAGAAALGQRLQRRLGALVVARDVAQALLDLAGERGQQLERAELAPAQQLQRPGAQLAARRIVPVEGRAEIAPLLGVVGERPALGIGGELVVGLVERRTCSSSIRLSIRSSAAGSANSSSVIELPNTSCIQLTSACGAR